MRSYGVEEAKKKKEEGRESRDGARNGGYL
jgi:hypothetical protein